MHCKGHMKKGPGLLDGLFAGLIALVFLVPTPGDQTASAASFLVPVQIPYKTPPEPEGVPDTTVPPNTEPLSPEEVKRAEALLPLLSGNQELWAMGEFVHLGAPAIPVLVKALTMPDPRLRYNAIETMGMIKAPSAAPALVEAAMEPNEMSRIRMHALQVAVRLDPSVTPEAIVALAKDPSESVRMTAAFQARYVRDKKVVSPLIDLVGDKERFVAVTAVQSLWKLTRHETEIHDWAISTQEDRIEWAQEWHEWWGANGDTFVFPEPRTKKRRRRL